MNMDQKLMNPFGNKRICRDTLHKTLGLPDKLAADFEAIIGNVPCYATRLSRDEDLMGYFTVIIKKSQPNISMKGVKLKSSSHRVFVRCPNCDREVPTGRTGQHKCVLKRHIK